MSVVFVNLIIIITIINLIIIIIIIYFFFLLVLPRARRTQLLLTILIFYAASFLRVSASRIRVLLGFAYCPCLNVPDAYEYKFFVFCVLGEEGSLLCAHTHAPYQGVCVYKGVRSACVWSAFHNCMDFNLNYSIVFRNIKFLFSQID